MNARLVQFTLTHEEATEAAIPIVEGDIEVAEVTILATDRMNDLVTQGGTQIGVPADIKDDHSEEDEVVVEDTITPLHETKTMTDYFWINPFWTR